MTNPGTRAGSARQAASQSPSTLVTEEFSSPTDCAEVELGRGRLGRDGTELVLHDNGALIHRSVLPGGVRVIVESMPGLRSTSTGMWFGVGSRDKVLGQEGPTHFLEHPLFKDTVTHDAHDIAGASDMIGGESNATTSKEHTSYYARVFVPNGIQALGVLADMVTSPLLESDDAETERDVIVSELAGAADNPANVVQGALARAALGEGTPLGRPIGETNETVITVPRDAVWECYKRTYASDALVAAAAGAVNHDGTCERVLADLITAGRDASLSAVPRERRFEVEPFAPLDVHDTTVPHESEQSHLYLTCQGVVMRDERRWAMNVFITILGGGMSSRLFQGVHEKRGLAYITHALDTPYAGVGTLRLHTGYVPGDVDEMCAIMIGEFEKLTEHGVTKREVMRARGQLCGAMVFGREDFLTRMGRLRRAEVVTGRLRSMGDSLRHLGTVTPEEVREMAAWLAGQRRARILVGPAG